MNILKMKRLLLTMPFLLSLIFCSTATYGQNPSKEEVKFWKNRAKMYVKRPLSLKSEFDNYQNQIADLKKRNKELMTRRGANDQKSEQLIDSLRWALIQVEGELQAQRKQNEELQKQLSNGGGPVASGGIASKGITNGLIYRVQIGAYVFNKVDLSNNLETGIQEEKSDGFNKYVVGGYRDYNEAVALKEQLEKIGVEEPWIVPYINGLRVTMEEARQFENNGFTGNN